MKRIITLVALSFFIINSCSEENSTNPEIQNNIPHFPDSIYSAIVNDVFELDIVLPENYDHEKPEGYDVVYVLDGEWLLYGGEDFMEEVGGTRGLVDSLQKSGLMPEVILIAIGYPRENHRHRDFLFPFDSINTESGGGELFYQFLKNELLPSIDNTFNTSGPEGRTLVGHSAGGYFTMYAFFRYQESDGTVFKRFLASSPNVYYHDFYLKELAKTCTEVNNNQILNLLYWSHGDGKFEMSRETIDELYTPVRNMRRFKIRLEIIEGRNHSTVTDVSIYKGLKWLFSQL